MEGGTLSGTSIFPASINGALESRAVRESLTWGPQAALLLCGFVWLVLYGVRNDELVRDPITIGIGLGASVLGAFAVIQILRRHARRVVIVPMADEVGVYREGRFAYRFPTSALQKDSFDWIYPIKMLIFTGILVLIMGGILAVELQRVSPASNDLWAFAYLFGYACFAFFSIVRSQFFLVWYWIPEGPEGGKRRVGFPRRKARRLPSAP